MYTEKAKRPYNDVISLKKVLTDIVKQERKNLSENDYLRVQSGVNYIIGMAETTINLNKKYNDFDKIDFNIFNQIFLPITKTKINDKFISSFIDFNEYESIVPDEIVHVNMLIQSNMYAVLLMFKYGWKFDSYHDIYSIINYNIYIGLDRLRLTGDETFCIHFFNYKLLDEMQQVINTMSAYFAEDLFNVITKLQTKDIENEVWW